MSAEPDLATATATQLMGELQRKKVSSLELTQAFITRIERLDQQINAVVVRDFEHALAEAKAADEAIARAESRPLLGLPMTVKESYDLKGFPTTWGLADHRPHRAREDAIAVQRLRAAGAVIMGKTNVPPVLSDWQSDNPVYGRTNNPYNLERSPGGSSGGSAAAIAMGFAGLELGSDIGGSVRIPAAFCGVFGHKSTYASIPGGGHAPGGLIGAQPPLGVYGPIGRSAEDIDLAMSVLAGPDEHAPANKLALPMPRHDRLSSFRVFLIDHHPAAAVDGEIRHAIEDVVDELTRIGASVARSSPLLPDLSAAWSTYQAILHTVMTRRASNGREPISAHAYLERIDEQHRLRRQWRDFFRHFDVVIAPAFGTVAFPHTSEPDWRKRSLIIDGEPTDYGAQLAWSSIATVANLPSTATPLGLSKAGMPLSAQVIGPHLEDRTAIAFAGMIARRTPPPKIAY